ncbi:CoA-transferase [Haloplanus pelagicus]|uniref:CoA-transferase n=1 Tax=Haloplanus pelagicus TaxID=2949995 RepID=UPI00203B71C9|nr:CoA-transferase [Haloplanus sp. HW8-1]
MVHTVSEKLTDPAEAVSSITPGSTITISGLGNMLCPEMTLAALEESYLSDGTPENLTVFTPIRAGNEGTGLEHLAHEGLLERLITGSFNTATQPGISELVTTDAIEAYAFPMGISFQLLEQQAAGSPGLLTDVGLGTYVDPRRKGAKYNRATEDLVEVREVDGEEYLFYRTVPIDVAILKGTTVDRHGNVSIEHEPNELGIRDMAMAARNSGGTVIAQVKRIAESTHGDGRSIAVPGALVDHVVVDPSQRQILGHDCVEEALTGRIHRSLQPEERSDVDALELRKRIILRRGLAEAKAGDLVNLGVGMPVYLPAVAKERDRFDGITFTTEHGNIGGTPNPEEFGSHYNFESQLKSADIFRLYQGGGLDVSFLGLAQIDGDGNVNNSNFAGMLRGPGGFIDITNRTDRLVFCGSLTAGGLDVAVDDGELTVESEGRNRKFVETVDEVTLDGQAALGAGSEITVITERGRFDVTDDGLVLTEIAPGVDVDRDVRQHIAFDVAVDDPLTTYDLDALTTSRV